MKMSKIIALTKIFLKNSFQNYRTNKTKEKKGNKIGMKILYAITFLYVAGFVGFLSYSMISQLAAIQQETVFLGLFFLAIAGFTVFQGIFTTMNVFYFSKDIEYVLPWPLSAKEILIAKLNTILVTEYIMEFLIGVIPLLLYGILTGAGILYYAIAAIILIVFPILPLLIASFFVMIVMSFAKLTKKRDAFQLIATIFIIVIVMAFQIGVQNQSGEMSEQQMIESLTRANGAVETIQNYFITLKPTINALSNTNGLFAILELVKVIAITIIAYIVVILIGQKLYLRGAVGNLVGGKTKKKKINVEKAYKHQAVGVSYVKKEFRILIRNPIFFMQCILPAVLMPVLFLGVFFFAGNSANEMKELFAMIPTTYSSVTICVILGLTQFFNMLTYVSATAFSRDGLNANFVKYVPLSLYKQFQYKATPNLIMNAITLLIVMGMLYYLFPATPILFLLAIFIVAMIWNVITSYVMLIVDLKRPKLEWSSEYAVVKQNMNLVFPVVLGLFGILMMVILGIVVGTVNPIFTLLGLTIVFGVICYILDAYVRKHQVKLFEKII